MQTPVWIQAFWSHGHDENLTVCEPITTFTAERNETRDDESTNTESTWCKRKFHA